MTASIVRIALVAISLALDVFAVCIGIGVKRPPVAYRIRIGSAFGSAEVLMCTLGAVLGGTVDRLIGPAASYIGFAALVGLGIYMIIESPREVPKGLDLSTGWGLFVASVSISLDSLGIGFTLPYLGVPIVAALVTIFIVSVCATALGLVLGGWLGERTGRTSGLFAGIVLAVTGAGFGLAHAFGME